MLLQRQLADLIKHPVEGFSAGLTDEEDIFKWEVRPLSYRPLSCRPLFIQSIRPVVSLLSFILSAQMSAVFHSFYPLGCQPFIIHSIRQLSAIFHLSFFQAFCLPGC